MKTASVSVETPLRRRKADSEIKMLYIIVKDVIKRCKENLYVRSEIPLIGFASSIPSTHVAFSYSY